MKTLISILALLFALPAMAQTSVTATITDSDGQTWNNGHGFATFNPSPAGYKCASPVVSPTNFTMDGSGTFTVSLADNTLCNPVGSQWTFTLCSNTSAPCSNVTAMVFGGTQNLSTQLSAGVKPPRFAATSSTQSFGYSDAEVTPVPVPGGWYFNVSSISARQWNGTAWQGFGGSGTANISHVQEMLSGDNAGNGIGMPEKGTTLVSGSPDTATVAWSSDYLNGYLDPRDPLFAGGVLGSTPQAAWQALSNYIVCDNTLYHPGRHDTINFPPGTFPVGTAANPTLIFPVGNVYIGTSGINGLGTVFQAGYNNVTALQFSDSVVATCSDGNPHTDTQTGGRYENISEHGCNQGGCTNKPGDTGPNWEGGPLQMGIAIGDSQGYADKIAANNNGADGVYITGEDTHTHEIWGSNNNYYFYFGLNQAGENYQFSNGECHGEVNYQSIDGQFDGPTETYGTFMTPGWEYGHIAGICWGGGNSYLGPYFTQIQEIGVIVAGASGGVMVGGRNDAPRGAGIRSEDSNILNAPRVISACRYDGVSNYLVYSVATATPGSGQTPGTYTLTASTGVAQIIVTVASGGTVTATPVVSVHGYSYTSTPPTFTLAAGGTPATFTVTMEPVFYNATANAGKCDYIEEEGGGGDTFISPSMGNNSFFGADHSTGDYLDLGGGRLVMPVGNGVNAVPILDAPGSFQVGQAMRISLPDSGQLTATGTTININATGGHIAMANSTPTTLTAITGGRIYQDIWILGDGFTTIPYSNTLATFGAQNCSGYALLLNQGQWYHYYIALGLSFGNGPLLVEQCDSINQNQSQIGWNPTISTSGLTQFTDDTFGSQIMRQIPLVTLTVADVNYGGGSSFQYCYMYDAIVWGEPYQSAQVCNAFTPVHSQTPNTQFLLISAPIPQGVQSLNLYLSSTTDPSFTPGLLKSYTSLLSTAPSFPPYAMQLVYNSDTTTPSGSVPYFPSAGTGINGTGGYNGQRATPSIQTEHCQDGDFKVGPAPTSVGGSGNGIFICHPVNTWTYNPFGAVVTTFTN